MWDRAEQSLITVIIVSYNEAQYISEAVESCLSQTYKNIEIIIGDDGSSDNSLEIIKNYEEEYCDQIRHFVMERPNDNSDVIASERASNIIKRGIKEAKGEYIACLSADDYYCDVEKFSDAVHFLNESPRYVAYVSGCQWVFQDGRKIPDRSRCPKWLYWACDYIHLSCFVFRKSVYKDGYLLNRFCDDIGMSYSLRCAGKWKYDPQITFSYRQREGSIMHTEGNLTLNILCLMVFQDCLCKGEMLWQSYSHFNASLRNVFRHRRELYDEALNKYFSSCSLYDHDVLGMIRRYETSKFDRVTLWILMIKSEVASFLFRFIFIFVKQRLRGRIEPLRRRIVNLLKNYLCS